jgi:hypothetical protein
MAFSHTYGIYNVEGTLVAWLAGQLAANKPTGVTTALLNLNHPEQPLAPPEWSVHFLGYDPDVSGIQGGHVGGGDVGGRLFGIMEVNCWVSRKTDAWRKTLNQMQDAVLKAVTVLRETGGGVVLRDFYTSENTPSALTAIVHIERAEVVTTAPDPNPDIERRRILIYFNWVERA